MNHRFRPALAVLALASLNLAVTASASEVWSESFDGAIDGTVPGSPYWQIDSASADSAAVISTSAGNASPSLHITDTSSSAQLIAKVKMNALPSFDTSLPATSGVKISFDWRIDSWIATTASSVPGFTLRDGGGTRLRIGFGRASLGDGDANSDLGFFATPATNGTMNASTAIGFTGTTWNAGFNFGDYDSGSSSNGTGNDFIHVEVVYFDQATTAELTLTRGLNTTTFVVEGITASTFSNAGNDVFEFSIPGNGMVDMYVDNIAVSTIPEPATTALLMAGAGLIGAVVLRRRRRR